jgi:hypothetical protein
VGFIAPKPLLPAQGFFCLFGLEKAGLGGLWPSPFRSFGFVFCSALDALFSSRFRTAQFALRLEFILHSGFEFKGVEVRFFLDQPLLLVAVASYLKYIEVAKIMVRAVQ